jgi:hypothetical protein
VSCLSAPVCLLFSFPPGRTPLIPFRVSPDLSKKVNLSHFNADLLVGRYIPNLTAEPYEVSKSYAEKIYNQTSSPRLSKILKNWDEEKWGDDENRNKLGYAMRVSLLLLIAF